MTAHQSRSETKPGVGLIEGLKDSPNGSSDVSALDRAFAEQAARYAKVQVASGRLAPHRKEGETGENTQLKALCQADDGACRHHAAPRRGGSERHAGQEQPELPAERARQGGAPMPAQP
jgi:hypothetical protein